MLMLPQTQRSNNWLVRAFNGVTKSLRNRVVALTVPDWQQGQQPTYFEHTFEKFVKEGYKRNELIYACIHQTASTASTVALRVYDRKTDEELPVHPAQLLIEEPNPQMSEYEFWYLVITHIKLAGFSYWQKIRNNGGEVVELWPIRPDTVKPIKTDQGVREYAVEIQGTTSVERIPATDLIVFSIPDPLDIFGSFSPMEVLARAADVDNSMTDFVKILMERGASPPGILSSKLKLRDDAITDILQRWEMRYGGYQNWNKPAVLDSDTTYQRVGLTLDELKFGDLDGKLETRICMVLQVPPIIIGATEGLQRSTFSNYESARKQWWEDVLSAMYKHLADTLNRQLIKVDYGTDVKARFDFSEVPALQEERNGRWTRATAAFSSGVITRNDAREEMGLELIEDPTVGDVFMQLNTDTAIPENGDNETEPSNPSDEAEDDDTVPEETEQDNEQKHAHTHTDNKAKFTPSGKPLSKEKATEVAEFTTKEQDKFFDLYEKLMSDA